MSNVQFDDSSTNYGRKRPDKHGWLIKFLKRQGIGEDMAQKILGVVAAVAFVLSLFFWF